MAITSLKTIMSIAGHSGPALMSSGHGGSVKIWDTRSNSPSIQSEPLSIHRAVYQALTTQDLSLPVSD